MVEDSVEDTYSKLIIRHDFYAKNTELTEDWLNTLMLDMGTDGKIKGPLTLSHLLCLLGLEKG